MWAIVFCVEKFSVYIAGDPCYVFTDHQGQVFSGYTHSPRVCRWTMKLTTKNIKMVYVKGTGMWWLIPYPGCTRCPLSWSTGSRWSLSPFPRT